MSSRWARAIAYGVVALLAVAAVLFTKPLPDEANRPAGEVLSKQSPGWRVRHDTLARGDNLMALLGRGGLSQAIALEAINAVKVTRALDFRRIPENMRVTVRGPEQDTLPSEIILQLAVDRLLHVERGDAGWVAREERLPWTTDTIVISGRITPATSYLYAAMDSAAYGVLPSSARNQLVVTLAEDIYEYRVDMSRDLQVGDAFRVVAQRRVAPNGLTRLDTVIAATMKLSGKEIEAVRFKSAKTGGLWFDQDGRPLRSGFLRSPLQFSRITSRYGMRQHPILGNMRKHDGIDYGAATGTPIRAIGDGVVIRAGWTNGYGNVVEIRHANGYVTRYGHMRSFAKGIYPGARVSQKETIGYVGSTGLSTGPHLHFEVKVKGVQRNPSQVLANVSADPIPAGERAAFAAARQRALALLTSTRYLASADRARPVSAQ